jgi:hypothetical protein
MATERALHDSQLAMMMCAATDQSGPPMANETVAAEWVAKALPRFPAANFDALVSLIEAEQIVAA